MKKIFYRVNEGETLLSVCEKLGVPPVVVIKENNLKSEIASGDLLYIEQTDCFIYKVTPFDTIKSISQKFGVSEEKILSDNKVPYIFYGLNLIIDK